MEILGTFNSTGNITAPRFNGTVAGNVVTTSINTPTIGGTLIVTPDITFSNYIDCGKGISASGDYIVSVSGYKVVSAVTPGFTTAVDINNTRATFNVPVRFGSYTTTQRNALTPSNGDVIYCTDSGPGSIGQFLGYANGAWVSLS
jgi:hypothetical protein